MLQKFGKRLKSEIEGNAKEQVDFGDWIIDVSLTLLSVFIDISFEDTK